MSVTKEEMSRWGIEQAARLLMMAREKRRREAGELTGAIMELANAEAAHAAVCQAVTDSQEQRVKMLSRLAYVADRAIDSEPFSTRCSGPDGRQTLCIYCDSKAGDPHEPHCLVAYITKQPIVEAP